MPARRSSRPAATTAPASASSQRHARGLVRHRAAAVVAAVLLTGVLGAGAGAAVTGPRDIEVFGWHPVSSGRGDQTGATAADAASSQRGDRSRTATPAATPGPTPTASEVTPTAEPTPSDPAAEQAQIAAGVVAATNVQRVAAGLPELAVSSCATEQVTARVAQLVATNAFEHPPLEPVLSACTVSGAAENLAKGYVDGAGVVDGWMNSENHKANLLGDWTETGVSCQLRSDGLWLCGAVYTRA